MNATCGQHSYALPPELTLMVMQAMDKPSLEASTRVCRNWLALGRPHLFESVAYAASRKVDQAPLADLAAFLHVSPHVCNFVSRLALRLGDATALLRPDGHRARCTLPMLADALRNLPRLSALTVDCFPLQCSEDVPTIPPRARLASLRIAGWYSPPGRTSCPNGVAHFLELFEEIDELSLGPSVHFPEASSEIVPGTTAPCVRALSVESGSTLCGLPAAMSLANLERLTFPVLTADSIASARTVLAAASHSLRHLTLPVHIPSIGPPTSDGGLHFLRELNLSALPALETLTLVLPAYGLSAADAAPRCARDGPVGLSFWAPAHTFVVGLVPALPQSTHTLCLALHFVSRDPALAFFRREWWDWRAYPMHAGWADLQDALAARAARGLRRVEFADALGGTVPESEQQAIVKDTLLLWKSSLACFV